MLVNILVNPLPNFNLSTDKLALCVGDSVQLTHDYMGAATYNWDVNGIQQSNQNSFNWKPNQQGAFEISLHIIDGNNCNGYDTLKPDLDVQNAPIAVFDFTPIDPDIENNTITFINQSVFASQYEWNFGDNSSLENAFNTSHLYTDTGTYTITLRINNAIGCQDQISKMIRIKPVYKLFIPTAFSPNGDGRNDEFGIVGTGITEVRMQIFNRWGEKLTELEGVNLSWNGKVQDKVVPIGIYIYYIEIKDINGERHNIKDKFLILR
jgi:gliding motility-associated-like protein